MKPCTGLPPVTRASLVQPELTQRHANTEQDNNTSDSANEHTDSERDESPTYDAIRFNLLRVLSASTDGARDREPIVDVPVGTTRRITDTVTRFVPASSLTPSAPPRASSHAHDEELRADMRRLAPAPFIPRTSQKITSGPWPTGQFLHKTSSGHSRRSSGWSNFSFRRSVYSSSSSESFNSAEVAANHSASWGDSSNSSKTSAAQANTSDNNLTPSKSDSQPDTHRTATEANHKPPRALYGPLEIDGDCFSVNSSFNRAPDVVAAEVHKHKNPLLLNNLLRKTDAVFTGKPSDLDHPVPIHGHGFSRPWPGSDTRDALLEAVEDGARRRRARAAKAVNDRLREERAAAQQALREEHARRQQAVAVQQWREQNAASDRLMTPPGLQGRRPARRVLQFVGVEVGGGGVAQQQQQQQSATAAVDSGISMETSVVGAEGETGWPAITRYEIGKPVSGLSLLVQSARDSGSLVTSSDASSWATVSDFSSEAPETPDQFPAEPFSLPPLPNLPTDYNFSEQQAGIMQGNDHDGKGLVGLGITTEEPNSSMPGLLPAGVMQGDKRKSDRAPIGLDITEESYSPMPGLLGASGNPPDKRMGGAATASGRKAKAAQEFQIYEDGSAIESCSDMSFCPPVARRRYF